MSDTKGERGPMAKKVTKKYKDNRWTSLGTMRCSLPPTSENDPPVNM